MPRVTLVQMPNGTGKTTTLTMIRAALTGEARTWQPDKVRSFQGVDSTGREDGRFLLELQVDEQPLTFEMTFDFVDGHVEYKTTSPTKGGVVHDWAPPQFAHRFFNEQFVHLFIFDGEFAERLLDANYSEADRAIDSLCQLYLFDQVEAHAERDWERLTRSQTAKTKSGLRQAQKQEQVLRQRISEVVQLRNEAVRKAEKLKEDIEDFRGRIDKEMTTQEQDRRELDERKSREQEAHHEVERLTSEILREIRQAHRLHPAFATALVTFKDQLDRVKLPESTSRQFFQELAEERDCVCGRPIDDKARETILRHASRYLGEEIAGVVNTLKQDVDLYIRRTSPEDESAPKEMVDKLRLVVNDWHTAQGSREVLERDLISRGGLSLQEKQKQLLEWEQELKDTEGLLRDIDRRPDGTEDQNTFCLAWLKQEEVKAKRKVSELTDTVQLREQTDQLQHVCQRAKEIARESIRREMIEEVNTRLARVLAREPVLIDAIDRSVRLRQRGASVGQTLAVGYTFLTTLLHRGQHQFPLLVDSPANPIDLNVRREVARMVPQLCEQFVGLTISSEREGFVSELASASGNNIRYVTLFRKSPGTTALQAILPKQGVAETQNAVLIEGRNYFMAFDMETEPEE